MDTRTGGGGPDGSRNERASRGLARLRTIALLFDQAFAIPGTKWRFGLDALFGLVPGIGDLAGAVVAVYALRVARMVGAPPVIQLHMLANIAVDAIVGTVPVLGDLFDFVFRAQTRNLALLEAYVASPRKAARRSRLGLVLIPLAIVIVFAALTAFGVWMLYALFHGLATSFSGR